MPCNITTAVHRALLAAVCIQLYIMAILTRSPVEKVTDGGGGYHNINLEMERGDFCSTSWKGRKKYNAGHSYANRFVAFPIA